MAKKATGRVLLNMDPEIHQQIIDVVDAKNSPYKDMTAFIREAITEKLDRLEHGEMKPELMVLYDKLNEEAKAWLEVCAYYASTSTEGREIKRRTRKK